MRARDKRLDRLRGAISAAPILPHILDEEYECFTMFGELPEEDHVAQAVLERALRGGADAESRNRRGLRVGVAQATAADDMMTVREPLFCEAMDENAYARRLARCAIALEVCRGGNVESRGFAGHHGLPVFGSVGMHVLGYPRNCIAPPYEFQGERLLTRHDELRARIDQRNPKWAEPVAEAVVAFRTKGELPRDELMLEMVLADAELDAHRANKKGRDVAQVMKLFDEVARADDEEREAALAKLCAMAKDGRLP